MRSKRELTGTAWINSREKRAMDLGYCTLALPFAIPIGLSALALSRVIDGKGALFQHQRITQSGRIFNLPKIRTLKNINPDELNQGIDDPRATTLGRKLRITGIDELPQIFSIFSGHMSVVGPRAASQGVVDYMEQALSKNLFDEWLEVYNLSKPGGISSSAIASRLDHNGLDREQIYKRRARFDLHDFNNANPAYDNKLILSAGRMAITLIGGSI